MKIFIVSLMLCFCACYAFTAAEALYDLNGKSISYEEIVSAPKTVLFFWTSHCPYCLKELIYMNENPGLFNGINVYFINLGEGKLSIAAAARHLKLREAITEKILLDTQVYLGDKFSIVGVPTYIFLANAKPLRRSYYIDSQLLEEIFKK